MDFREKLKSQRNKVVYSITDKCILIGGYQGSGFLGNRKAREQARLASAVKRAEIEEAARINKELDKV